MLTASGSSYKNIVKNILENQTLSTKNYLLNTTFFASLTLKNTS